MRVMSRRGVGQPPGPRPRPVAPAGTPRRGTPARTREMYVRASSEMRVAAQAALMRSVASLFMAAAAVQAAPTDDNALMKLERFSDHGLQDALCEP